jgi:hypothetical protein
VIPAVATLVIAVLAGLVAFAAHQLRRELRWQRDQLRIARIQERAVRANGRPYTGNVEHIAPR